MITLTTPAHILTTIQTFINHGLSFLILLGSFKHFKECNIMISTAVNNIAKGVFVNQKPWHDRADKKMSLPLRNNNLSNATVIF